MMAKKAMVEQRRRRYREGDRVRVWRKVGERATTGTVTAVVDGTVKVRFDGESGSRIVDPLHTAPFVERARRRRTGILLTAGALLVVIVALVGDFGLLPLEPPARIGLFAVGLIALYVVVRGILMLRDSVDPLRPLPTYDPGKDYTTNNAG